MKAIQGILGKANTRIKKAFFIFTVTFILIFIVGGIVAYFAGDKKTLWFYAEIPLIYLFLIFFFNGFKGVLSGKTPFSTFVIFMGVYTIFTIGVQAAIMQIN